MNNPSTSSTGSVSSNSSRLGVPSHSRHPSREQVATIDINHINRDQIFGLNNIKLGKGTFGSVEKCLYRENSESPKINVAIKFANNNAYRDNLIKEAKVLYSLQAHPHCVKIFGIYDCPRNGWSVVMEYMDCKSLADCVVNPSMSYDIDHVIFWMYQLASAIDFIHSVGQMHRDLKLQNLLLSRQYLTLKVCDFGTATSQHDSMTQNLGTPITMAPEIFKGDKMYNEKCDIYSMGIIMWQLISRRDPYDRSANYIAVLWNVAQREKRPPELTCDPILSGFYKRCWQNDPKARPTGKEVKEYFRILRKVYPNPRPLGIQQIAKPVSRPSLPKISNSNGNEAPEPPAQATKPGHRRLGSDQSTLIKKEEEAARSNRSRSVAVSPQHPQSPQQQEDPTAVDVLEWIDPTLKPAAPIQTDRASMAKYNEHVAICHQMYDIEQELRFKFAAKHHAIARLDQLNRIRNLVAEQKRLEALKAQILTRIPGGVVHR